MDSTEKVAVITGGNRGIGFEICKQLAAQGYRVILTARSLEKAREAAARLSSLGLVEGFEADLTNEQSIEKFKSALRSRVSHVNLLVNNAAVNLDHPEVKPGGRPPSILESSADIFAKTFETNVVGAFLVSRALVDLLKESKGSHIINISSGMGQLSGMGSGWPSYRISKTALNALTQILASDLKELGIHVNSVCPGWVRTDMGGNSADLSVEEGARNVLWVYEGARNQSGKFFKDCKEIAW